MMEVCFILDERKILEFAVLEISQSIRCNIVFVGEHPIVVASIALLM